MFDRIYKIENPHLKDILMTLFEMVEALQADVATLKAAPAAVDQTAAIAAVDKKVTDLAALVGTPAAPPAA